MKAEVSCVPPVASERSSRAEVGDFRLFCYICQRKGISISVVILSTMTCWN